MFCISSGLRDVEKACVFTMFSRTDGVRRELIHRPRPQKYRFYTIGVASWTIVSKIDVNLRVFNTRLNRGVETSQKPAVFRHFPFPTSIFVTFPVRFLHTHCWNSRKPSVFWRRFSFSSCFCVQKSNENRYLQMYVGISPLRMGKHPNRRINPQRKSSRGVFLVHTFPWNQDPGKCWDA